jgi:cell division septal protein FtsQ
MPRHLGPKKVTRSRSRLGVQASEAPAEGLVRRPGGPRLAAYRLPGLLLLVLGLMMLRHMMVAQRFTVSVVEVTGTQILSPELVRASVGLMGDSIFGISEREVERTLTARYACVQAATVDCQLPATCKVQVVEVRDVIIWEQGGEAWWVALDGRVLGPATAAAEAPVVQNGGPYLAPQDGYLVGVPWRYALAAGRVLQHGEQIEFKPGFGLVVHLGEERLPVYLGEEGDVAAKLALASDALAEAKRRGAGIAYIDLRSETRPIVVGL